MSPSEALGLPSPYGFRGWGDAVLPIPSWRLRSMGYTLGRLDEKDPRKGLGA